MKKLTLNLNALQVQSFETARERAGGGTVRGHDWGYQETINYCGPTELDLFGCGRTLATGCLTCPQNCTAENVTCRSEQCGV